jgi:hypothetical protein
MRERTDIVTVRDDYLPKAKIDLDLARKRSRQSE